MKQWLENKLYTVWLSSDNEFPVGDSDTLPVSQQSEFLFLFFLSDSLFIIPLAPLPPPHLPPSLLSSSPQLLFSPASKIEFYAMVAGRLSACQPFKKGFML